MLNIIVVQYKYKVPSPKCCTVQRVGRKEGRFRRRRRRRGRGGGGCNMTLQPTEGAADGAAPPVLNINAGMKRFPEVCDIGGFKPRREAAAAAAARNTSRRHRSHQGRICLSQMKRESIKSDFGVLHFFLSCLFFSSLFATGLQRLPSPSSHTSSCSSSASYTWVAA